MLLAVLILLAQGLITLRAADAPTRWSAEKANVRARQTGWLVGYNYIPGTAVNELALTPTKSPPIIGKGGQVYPHRGALVVEPQHYPDSANHPNFPPPELKPGQTYRNVVIYRFSTECAPQLRLKESHNLTSTNTIYETIIATTWKLRPQHGAAGLGPIPLPLADCFAHSGCELGETPKHRFHPHRRHGLQRSELLRRILRTHAEH